MQQIIVVHPHGARFQTVADIDSGVEVGRVQGGSETVSALVANLDGVGRVLEFGDGAHGAKNLFLHDLHVFGHVAEDRWLNEVPLGTMALAANLDFCAGFLAFVDIARKRVSVFIDLLR